jgi:hypothetical protein
MAVSGPAYSGRQPTRLTRCGQRAFHALDLRGVDAARHGRKRSARAHVAMAQAPEGIDCRVRDQRGRAQRRPVKGYSMPPAEVASRQPCAVVSNSGIAARCGERRVPGKSCRYQPLATM